MVTICRRPLWMAPNMISFQNLRLISHDFFRYKYLFSNILQSNRLEGLRRFTVFWHISASLADNCKEWSKLQVSGKDLSRCVFKVLTLNFLTYT